MNRTIVLLAVAFALVVLTSSAGGAVAGPAPASVSGPAPAGLVTDAIALPASSSERALSPSTPVSLTFTLANPRSQELDRFLSGVEDPLSPLYRHFLSSAEFEAEFAPPSSQVAAVELALSDAGARDITSAPDGAAVLAVLPARSVDQLLGVDLVSYGRLGRTPLYTAVGTVSLPSSLEGLVAGIGGLSDAATAELAAASTVSSPMLRPVDNGPSLFIQNTSTGEQWFLGSDYTQMYNATALFPGSGSVTGATYPTSVAIATLLASSYNETFNFNLPPWDPAVVHTYFNGTLGSGWPMPNFTGVPVVLDGVTPPAPASFGNQTDSTDFEIENSLDLEMAGSLAPGASIFNFYFAGGLVVGNVAEGDVADYFASDLDAALNYTYTPAHLAVVSCSFGLPDLNDSFWNVELLRAAAMGVTIVAASGDQGNAPNADTGRTDGQWPVWPATDATNVSGALSVGGVSLTLGGTPSATYNGSPINLTYDSNDGAVTSMSAWYDTLGGPGAIVGTEGGISTVYPEPSWQYHSAAQPNIVNATLTQGAAALGRAGPDVAMPANATIATVFANSTGTVFFTLLEGTSVAAPVLAGLLADVVAVENNRSETNWTSLGFVDPEIYRFASFFELFPNATSNPFEDVTTGRNWVFSAGPGWDATTGWGGVIAPAFVRDDETTKLLDFNYTLPVPGLPPVSSSSGGPVPWPYIYAVFGVGIVAAIVLVAFAARPSRSREVPPGVPWGAQMGGPTWSNAPAPPGTYPGATFLCPYCGAIRPAEPVRCPQCKMF